MATSPVPGDVVYALGAVKIDHNTNKHYVDIHVGVMDKTGGHNMRPHQVEVELDQSVIDALMTAVTAGITKAAPKALSGGVLTSLPTKKHKTVTDPTPPATASSPTPAKA